MLGQEESLVITYRHVVGLLALHLFVPTPVSSQAGSAPSRRTVLFVCEHGTVKSLLAKVLFEEYAAKIGLDMNAVSRGTQADSLVPEWMLQALASDRVMLGPWRPQTLKSTDLVNASYVVSFDVPGAATAAARVPRAQWDGLPSVSQDYRAGRDAIKARVHQLADSLKRASPR